MSNHVEISGGVVRPPDFAHTEGGYPIWRCTIATNDAVWNPVTRQQEVKTTYVRVTFGGQKADALHECGVTQGDELLVIGALDNNTWKNKDTGKTESKTQVRGVTFDRLRSGSKMYLPPEPETNPWPLPPSMKEAR